MSTSKERRFAQVTLRPAASNSNPNPSPTPSPSPSPNPSPDPDPNPDPNPNPHQVTFIDTPGLVDGTFHYAFPVEEAMLAVAKHTDLIYVFFDPIGQAPTLTPTLTLTPTSTLSLTPTLTLTLTSAMRPYP